MMCCGTASLKDVDKGELSLSGGGGESPRKEKKVGAMVAKEKKAPPEVAKSKKKKPAAGKKENPYASLGLDKFSNVLAELETRREKVLRRVDGGDRVMVRFVQSRAKEWVPVVVRLPPEEPAAKGGPRKKCKLGLAVSPPAPTQPLTPREDVKRAAKGEPKSKCKFKAAVPPPLTRPSTPRSTEYYCAWPKEDDVKLAAADAAKSEPKKKCKLISAVSPPLTQPSTPRSTEYCAWPKEDVKHATVAAKATAAVAVAPAKKKATTPAVARLSSLGKKVTRPSQYWPFVAVLLLVTLVMFGRVFAICCTSVWWYLVPILSGGGEEGQSAKTGKNLGKKASGKLTWPSLPPSHGKKNSSGALQVTSPRSHAHGKKG